MVRTMGNQKMSIMVVLSMTILAILVTGTEVNIVSAAKSINVQLKANQHPVTGTFNAQTKTNQLHITSAGTPRGKYLHAALCNGTGCITKFFKMRIDRVGVSEWRYTAELDGNVPSGGSTFYGISYAPITVGILTGDDRFNLKVPGKTDQYGTSIGAFHICDNGTNDHYFYVTMYFEGGYYTSSAFKQNPSNLIRFDPTSSHDDSFSKLKWFAQNCASGK
jgi:hypothetical protein